MYLTQNLNVLRMIAASNKNWTAEIYTALKVKLKVTIATEGDEAGQIVEEESTFSPQNYADALTQFQATFSNYEYFFENLMIVAALCMSFPHLDSKEALWKNYVSLCNLYSFYRFVSVLGCKKKATKEQLFHMIVMASRAMLHDLDRFNGFQEKLFQNDSSTLAHMAILLCWD